MLYGGDLVVGEGFSIRALLVQEIGGAAIVGVHFFYNMVVPVG